MSANGTVRIAWMGPGPDIERGGVPSLAAHTLLGLAESGAEIEAFVDSPRTEFLAALAERPNVRISGLTSRWRYDRWYSSTKSSALLTGTAARVHLGARIAERLAERHAARPFDVAYRLSQIELLALRKHRRRLPPIVLHPEVHAHGELRHHWRERALALSGESLPFYALNHAYLGYRAMIQRRDLRDVTRIVAPSARFADLVAADYDYPRERIRVLPNVIDIERFHPAAVPSPGPVRLLYVSRLAVRKGFEQVVELSHRVRDLAGRAQIDVYGDASSFSNYTSLVAHLDPAVAHYHGQLAAGELPDVYRAAHGLLQPSMYEPYALTVGEALASGLPVIVSDEVGAREGVDARVCRVHAAGDVAGLEREVRRLVDEVERGWDPELRRLARAHAEANLTRDRFARELVELLAEVRS
jgi:glycosyltransferase involved in cell wall biosynthesis